MFPKIRNFRKYHITYFSDLELDILLNEIFKKEIYNIELESKKPVIYDIGAHIGLATIYFKSRYPESTILCFEPNPNVIPLLEENIFQNNLNNIEIHNVAISNKDGYRDLYMDSSGLGAFSTASFIKDAWNGKQASKAINVKTERLTSYLDNDVDLVKIDTEGEEEKILEDINKANLFSKIKNLIIEFHPVGGRSSKRITSMLRENGYDVLEGEKDSDDLVLIVAKKRRYIP